MDLGYYVMIKFHEKFTPNKFKVFRILGQVVTKS